MERLTRGSRVAPRISVERESRGLGRTILFISLRPLPIVTTETVALVETIVSGLGFLLSVVIVLYSSLVFSRVGPLNCSPTLSPRLGLMARKWVE